MAFPKSLAQRLLSMARVRQASPRSPAQLVRRIVPDPGEAPGLIRRILQRRPLFQSTASRVPPDRIFGLVKGGDLVERIKGLGGDRIRLDGLVPPAPPAAEAERGKGMTVEEVKKVLRASQMEAVRSRLRAVPRSCVSHAEFIQVCCEASSAEQGPAIARSLDESGAVIVLGDAVFLRPDQELVAGLRVARAIESMIPHSISPRIDQRMEEELREMEEKKALIDTKAEALVRRELRCGLGFFVVQTLGFMKLTFWDLSWDVMEPICFYVTSIYVMAGYTFFLRTSKEPSFESFFSTRFTTKQRRLMKAHNFDLNRFNELKSNIGALQHRPTKELTNPHNCQCNRSSTLIRAAH